MNRRKRSATHSEGMPETPIRHPDQGAEAVFPTYPVVAICLPPANFLNRFAVKHTIHNYILHITMLAIDITHALNLSMNRNLVAKRRFGQGYPKAKHKSHLVAAERSEAALGFLYY